VHQAIISCAEGANSSASITRVKDPSHVSPGDHQVQQKRREVRTKSNMKKWYTVQENAARKYCVENDDGLISK